MAHPLPATLKRIHREIADVQKEDLGSITLAPSDDLFLWFASLPGPEGSVYQGGVFNLAISLPPDYPFSAPKVTFRTRIYHMNISDQGNICIDVLKHNWSPALSLFKVILSLSSLLTDPNPKDPLVPSIATQYTRNRKLHDSTAREWTDLYARPKTPPPPPAPCPEPKAKVKSSKKAARPSVASTSSNDLIVIDSSDDEEHSRRAGKKRKRNITIDLVDSNDDEDNSSRKRPAGSSRRPFVQGEVIEID